MEDAGVDVKICLSSEMAQFIRVQAWACKCGGGQCRIVEEGALRRELRQLKGPARRCWYASSARVPDPLVISYIEGIPAGLNIAPSRNRPTAEASGLKGPPYRMHGKVVRATSHPVLYPTAIEARGHSLGRLEDERSHSPPLLPGPPSLFHLSRGSHSPTTRCHSLPPLASLPASRIDAYC